MPTYDLRRRPESGACARFRLARTRRASLPLLLLALAAGCDVPTSLPKWDTQWLVPVKSTRITVAQLLPASVTTSGDGSRFLVTVAPLTISRSLGELCSACVALNGLTVPKPAFTTTVSDTLRLPSDVVEATLDAGSIPATITNGLGFDPIRPSATARGTLQLSLPSGSSTAGGLTLDGATDSLPAGSTSTRSIGLMGGIAIGGRTAAVLTVTSPAGGTVRIDTNQRFSVTASPQGVRVLSVKVAVTGKPVSIQPIALSVSDIDQSIVDRVRGGALVLNIVNQFGVSGTLTMTISGPGVTIHKPIQLPASTSTQRVPFTEDELRSILGKSGVTVTASGTVNASGPVTLGPSFVCQVNAQLELTLGSTQGS